jgi:hypothetical protein
MDRDVFICHASEDKPGVVRPLVAALQNEGITCWLDEGEIQWGDSITQKVNEGLRISRFVIVVLSEAFLHKNWPKRELNAILNMEASSGEVKVLPLLVGEKNIRDRVSQEFLLLNDKLYIAWEGTPVPVVKAARDRLSKESDLVLTITQTKDDQIPGEDIPLPRIRKRFTQREKDIFLKMSFSVVHDYFKLALSELEKQYPDVEIDFTEINTQKFAAKVYLRGEAKCQCKIWMGGLSGAEGIAYSENRIDFNADNSFNELMTVEDNNFELKLKNTLGSFYLHQGQDNQDPKGAAEMLWKRFTKPLEYQ